MPSPLKENAHNFGKVEPEKGEGKWGTEIIPRSPSLPQPQILVSACS